MFPQVETSSKENNLNINSDQVCDNESGQIINSKSSSSLEWDGLIEQVKGLLLILCLKFLLQEM